jgi:hypothetical protein
LSKERVHKLNAIRFEWDPFEAQWPERHDELVQYVNKHGNALVPQRYENKLELGNWVKKQRELYKAGKLSVDKIQKLVFIGFVWDPFEAQWLDQYEELVQYVNQHGNALVPKKCKNNPSLGVWVDTQRQLYKAGKLSDERIQKLGDVRFEWDPRQAQWLESCEECKGTRKCIGSSRVREESCIGLLG